MKRKLLATTALALACAAPAVAADFIVTYGSAGAIDPDNSFKSTLTNSTYNLAKMTNNISSLKLSGPATVKFEVLGSESAFNDAFGVLGPGSVPVLTYMEHSPFQDNFAAPINIGSYSFTGSGLIDLYNNLVFAKVDASNNVIWDGVSPIYYNSPAFGLFMPNSAASGGGTYTSTVLYLGYDDQFGQPDDDNHDDLMIRMTITSNQVPEPAAWALLLSGFAAVGAAMRRRPGLRTRQAV